MVIMNEFMERFLWSDGVEGEGFELKFGVEILQQQKLLCPFKYVVLSCSPLLFED